MVVYSADDGDDICRCWKNSGKSRRGTYPKGCQKGTGEGGGLTVNHLSLYGSQLSHLSSASLQLCSRGTVECCNSHCTCS